MDELDLFKSDKLSKAVEALAEAVIITDPGGTITYVNPAFEKITGYKAQEALGQNPRILKSGRNPPEMYKEMWDVLLAGKIWRGQVINKRKDGSLYHAELTVSPIWSDTGRILSYVAVQREVTQQLKTEEQVRLRTLEYQVLHGVAKALYTPAPLEEKLQGALKALVGFKELEVENKAGIFLAEEAERKLRLFTWVGEFSQEFLEKEQTVPYGDCLCGKAAESGELLVSNNCFSDTRHERLFEDMTAHGHYIVPLKSRDKLIGVLFLYTDPDPPWYERSQEILLSIADLIAAAIETEQIEEQVFVKNRELARANEELQRLNEQKNEFLGIAAHDLRNPLYLIRSYSELLKDGSLGEMNPEQLKAITKIYESSNHMIVLLNNLLDISKIESGRLDLNKTKGNLDELINKWVDMGRILAEKKHISLEFSLGNTPDVEFDPNAIRQVLDNLVGNAIKFSPPNSRIYISTERVKEGVRVSVRDEGPGISKEDMTRLFGKFQTLSAKPTGGENPPGSGWPS